MTNSMTKKKGWTEAEKARAKALDAAFVDPAGFTIEEFIAKSKWTFAKTLAHIPHEYTVRGRTDYDPGNDGAWFTAAVLLIRREGYRAKFGKTAYTYLDVDGWHYWTMGMAMHTPSGSLYTNILNRAKGTREELTPQTALDV